jgi:hypothetical protein
LLDLFVSVEDRLAEQGIVGMPFGRVVDNRQSAVADKFVDQASSHKCTEDCIEVDIVLEVVDRRVQSEQLFQDTLVSDFALDAKALQKVQTSRLPWLYSDNSCFSSSRRLIRRVAAFSHV